MYMYIYIYGWWFQPIPLKKYDFVNGKDDIPYNYYGKLKFMWNRPPEDSKAMNDSIQRFTIHVYMFLFLELSFNKKAADSKRSNVANRNDPTQLGESNSNKKNGGFSGKTYKVVPPATKQ